MNEISENIFLNKHLFYLGIYLDLHKILWWSTISWIFHYDYHEWKLFFGYSNYRDRMSLYACYE